MMWMVEHDEFLFSDMTSTEKYTPTRKKNIIDRKKKIIWKVLVGNTISKYILR